MGQKLQLMLMSPAEMSYIVVKCCMQTRRMVERTLDFEIDQRDRYGRTALMWAAEMNHKETCETLIDLGSDRRQSEPHSGRYVEYTGEGLRAIVLLPVGKHETHDACA